jgi:glycosyltransferase involved in cell wall biosynthesis/SAM-dependent methyltransferase
VRFVIEAMGLTDSGGKRIGVDLLSHLSAHPRHDFVLLIPDLPEYEQIEGANIKAIRRPVPKALWARHWLLSRTVPQICRREYADALLGLGNFVPRNPNCPAAVLLQNAHLVNPELFGGTQLRLRELLIHAYGRYHYRHLPAAICVVVQTEVMKERVCARLGIDSRRVLVIPPGPLVESKISDTCAPDPAPAASRAFTFLCMSRYYVHKNIEILAAAMSRLPLYTKIAAQCLITISADQHPRAAALLKTISCGGVANPVVNLGPIDPARIGDVYRSADAYILPTLLETYSLTYDEAMHFGLPIATSARDFAQQRLGDAALYFDPLDADSVARAMARIMENADLRQSLVENGKRLLEQVPTWDEIAGRFVEVLEQMATGQLLNANGTGAAELPTANDVRKLFNDKAHCWRGKYGPRGKLDSRVEQFTGRLSQICPTASDILELGCGTGEIAAAIGHRGYSVTACDFAEEMIAIARGNPAGKTVNWVCLDPDWKIFPFEDGSFDGVVASSVFEYLVDVPQVAAELARILRPGGNLLLTVPNPFNPARKLETWFPSKLLHRRLPLLHKLPALDSYASYLRLSRNRFRGDRWESLLTAAGFVVLDRRDFSEGAWLNQAKAPLILVSVKKAGKNPVCQFGEAAKSAPIFSKRPEPSRLAAPTTSCPRVPEAP